MGIEKRPLLLRVISTVLILLITVTLSFAAYAVVVRSEEEHCWQYLSETANSISREMIIRMDDNCGMLRLAAGAIARDDSLGTPQDILNHVNEYLSQTMFCRIDVLLPDNSLMMHDGRPTGFRSDFSFDELVASGVHISRRITDVLTGNEVIIYNVPVVSDGQPIAVLMGVIECNSLPDYFQPTIYGGRAKCLLVDRADGSIIMDTTGDPLDNFYELEQFRDMSVQENATIISAVRNSNSGVIDYTSLTSGQDCYMYYCPVEGQNWQLLLIVRQSSAFEHLGSLGSSLFVMLGAAILVIIISTVINVISINNISRSKAEAERQLHKSNVLIECVTELSTSPDIDRAINNLLAIINGYFGGDRTYLFDLDYENQTTSNLYEYAIEGVSKEIDNLQNVPISAVDVWLEEFRRTGIFYISDIDRDVNRDSNTYDILAAQDIHSLIAVPLLRGDTITGYMGVDNPKCNYNDLTLLSSVQFFITEAMERKASHEALTQMSYTDTLTHLHNRNKFNHVCDDYSRYPRRRVGVAFFDLDGLKHMNDTYGHDAGDRLIVSAADNIRSLFSGNSYRIGGDEFAVIVPDVDRDAFDIQVDKVRNLMKKNDISVAIGVSWHEECLNIRHQLKEADERMYVEKAEHRRLAAEKTKIMKNEE